ncbi:MAG: class I SAM-dependent methyltransferase [Roseburia sp.]|nr:class I SAM-dependent methyltransferase [Roseburia sp.]MCM1242724.1 class I SAM-dependent methyltransferase [Roseburia sp.]
MSQKIVLSQRMQAAALLVTGGNRVCDVGCDHAFVPIYLVEQGIAPKALAMDINEGPLRQARENIAAFGLEAYIETRISDGLASYHPGEADSLICAGMGGRLMQRILAEEKEKTDSFRELILQPQSEIQKLRAYLRREGHLIVDENMIEEDSKFYPLMKVIKKDKTLTIGNSFGAGMDEQAREHEWKHEWKQQMEDRYGPVLLAHKNPVLYRYLEREKRIFTEVLNNLRKNGADKEVCGKRYREVKKKSEDCQRVMEELNKREGAGIW